MNWKYKIGFLIGLIFGLLGLWLIAFFALSIPQVEKFTDLLFTPGRSLAYYLAPDGSAGNVIVTLLFFINGILYGLIGLIFEITLRSIKQR